MERKLGYSVAPPVEKQFTFEQAKFEAQLLVVDKLVVSEQRQRSVVCGHGLTEGRHTLSGR